MNYKSTIEFMYKQLPMYQRQGKAAYKADLETSLAFDNFLDFPHRSFKTIHVAGTNGKGSVSHMLASVLQEQGLKVALYTSPHLKSFRERIRVNGELVSEQFVVNFIEKIKQFIEQEKPSFFEMTVFMAFQYFKEQNVDIAVIEVGMGGRLDSTNVINPVLSIITNISLDHTAFLGNTITQIAVEKAGIIKENTPLVIGESQTETGHVFIEKAKQNNSEIFFADKKYKIDYTLHSAYAKQTFNVKLGETIVYENLSLDLLGSYQAKNLKTVLMTIDVLNNLGFSISKDNIYSGLANVVKNTGLKGRWQILGNNPLIVCDTGHNKAGVTEITEQLEQIPYKKLHIVFGAVNDKNIEEILRLLPQEAAYYFTQANIERALDVDILYEKAKQVGLNGEKYKSIELAFDKAKQNAEKNDVIFIGGSTFVVAELEL